MKILVLSDTHGKTQHLKTLSNHKFDELWYLGDFYKDAKALTRMLGIPVSAVKGNCDLEPHAPEELVLEREGHRILLTHGHLYGVKTSLLKLFYKGEQDRLDLICFGHTHLRVANESGGIKLFNPGSPSKPHIGDRPSIGILEIHKDSIKMSHELLPL